MVAIIRNLLPVLCLSLVLFSFFNIGLDVASAQGGIVPACKVGDPNCENPYGPENYGICELVATFNNVLGFIVSALGLIAVLIVVYIGLMYTMSVGNPAIIAKGKQMFVNVIVGLVIALSAYLIVHTIMNVFMGEDNPLTPWRSVECTYEGGVGEASREISQ